MKTNKKDLLVYFLYFILTLVFFFRFLDGAEIFGFKDLSRYFYPLRHLMVEQVKSGHWPLWNPYIFCGFPLLATLQIGFFYPLTVIHYFLPFDLAFNYYTILHYFLAASFMFMLMRHFKFSRTASFLSGLIFAFSGYLLSVSNMNTSLSSVIWLPLVILWWDRLLGNIGMKREEEGGGGIGIIGMKREKEGGGGKSYKIPTSPYSSITSLIILLSLMFLGGEPTIIYVTGWLLLLYALIFYKDRLKNAGILILIFAAVALLVSAQLLPFLELILQSDRAQMANFELIAMRSFPPREIINFILPFFFGNQLRPGNYTEYLLGQNIQDWLLSPYLGFFALFFAALAWLKPDKRIFFFSGAGLLALLLAFGKYTPLYLVVYKLIPGVSLIRYPVKYLFLTTFSLSFLAGAGLEEFMKETGLRKIGFYISILLVGLGILCLGMQIFQDQIFNIMKSHYPPNLPGFFISELYQTYKFDIKSIFNLWSYMLAGGLVWWLFIRKVISSQAASIFYIGLIFIDLASVNMPLACPVSPEIYHETTPNLKILMKDKELFRYYYSREVEKVNRLVYGVDFDQALLENKDRLAANRLMPHHLYDVMGYESVELASYRRFLMGLEEEVPFKYINSLNAKYVATEKAVRHPSLRLVRHAGYYFGELYLYQNHKVLPRAYAPGGSAEILEYRPDEVIIRTRMKKPGGLLLADTYYPGWKAYINGRETKIVRSHELFREVALDRGAHTVRFTYDPWTFKAGLIISILTVALLMFFSVKTVQVR